MPPGLIAEPDEQFKLRRVRFENVDVSTARVSHSVLISASASK